MPNLVCDPAVPDRMRSRGRLPMTGLVSLALALGLGACSFGGSDVACPGSRLVPDLRAVVRFKPGAGRTDNDLAYGARLLDASNSCHWLKKDKSIEIASKLGIQVVRTTGDVKEGQVVYFAAIVDRQNTILAKRDFTVNLKFSGNERRITITDDLHMVLPLMPNTTGADYAVLFGFQLTPEELEYNRAHLNPSQPTPATPPTGPTPQTPGLYPPGTTPLPGTPQLPGAGPTPSTPAPTSSPPPSAPAPAASPAPS
jgi:hypothetical protein